MGVFCFKEYFTFMSCFILPPFCMHLPTLGSEVQLSCGMFILLKEKMTTLCLSLQGKEVLFLEIPATEFLPEILLLHCFLLCHCFRECIVGKLAIAVLTASMVFTRVV